MLALGLVPAVVVIGIGLRSVRSSDSESEIQEYFTDLARTPDAGTIVATVNGDPVYLRQLLRDLAMTRVPGATDGKGRPAASVTPEEVLEHLIDSRILALAAEASGITVTDEEIDQVITASIIAPLNDRNVPAETKETIRLAYYAQGKDPYRSLEDADIRASIRRFILTNKYVGQSGRSREELLVEARPKATVERFPERIPRQK